MAKSLINNWIEKNNVFNRTNIYNKSVDSYDINKKENIVVFIKNFLGHFLPWDSILIVIFLFYHSIVIVIFFSGFRLVCFYNFVVQFVCGHFFFSKTVSYLWV